MPLLQRRLFRLALPNALANLTVPLAGLVDTAMLGHLDSLAPLAGVALGSVLFDYLYWSFGFLRMGTTGLTAQAVGRDQPDEISLALLRALGIAGVIGLLIMLFQRPLIEIGFLVLSGENTVESAGRAYAQARIWGAFATLTNFVFLGWFLGRERSTWVLIMALVGGISNILLDYLFIFRWHWGAFGAGAATAISQYLTLATAIALCFIFPRKQGDSLWSLRQRIFDRPQLLALMRLNRDILVRTFCLISAFATFINLSATLGTLTPTINAILLRILALGAHLIDAVAFGAESLAGIFRGQKNPQALQQLLHTSLVWGLMIALGIIGALALAPQFIYGLLTSHAAILSGVQHMQLGLFITLLLGSAAFILDGFFIGLTEGRILRNGMLISLGLGFLPLALLASHLQSNLLLWTAFATFMGVRALTLWRAVPNTIARQLMQASSMLHHSVAETDSGA